MFQASGRSTGKTRRAPGESRLPEGFRHSPGETARRGHGSRAPARSSAAAAAQSSAREASGELGDSRSCGQDRGSLVPKCFLRGGARYLFWASADASACE